MFDALHHVIECETCVSCTVKYVRIYTVMINDDLNDVVVSVLHNLSLVSNILICLTLAKAKPYHISGWGDHVKGVAIHLATQAATIKSNQLLIQQIPIDVRSYSIKV